MSGHEDAIGAVERVLASGLLHAQHVRVPTRGATSRDLAAMDAALARPLSEAHRRLLTRWDGLNLGAMQVFGSQERDGLRSLVKEQSKLPWLVPGAIVFADAMRFSPRDDANGIGKLLGLLETEDGAVHALDCDSGELTWLAEDLDDCFARVLFGVDASGGLGPILT